ncbi:MAG TPA: GDP-mannose 4,6-dehydratase [Polyangiales bacterium]|nr:GDP-mannose 4,6-dehydratase [Polyangiales bacterium]
MSSFWEGRPVFVTGATGLLGSCLTRRLVEAKAEVVCLVRDWVPQSELFRSGTDQKCRIVRGDVRDQALMERVIGEYETRSVFHLAAQTIVGIASRNPTSTWETNVGGTWALLEACRRSPLIQDVVIASSDKAYGVQQKLPYTEDASLTGTFPYDCSKSCTDLISQSYAITYDMPVGITRCGNFYGPGDLNWNRIVPGTIRSLFMNERPQIRSNGKFVRDYFFIEDGAAAYMHLAEQLSKRKELRGQAFNFSTELPMSVLDVVDKIKRAMNSKIEPEILNQATHEIPEQFLSAEKARKLLSWKPLYSFDESLARTIPWYQELLGVRKS